MTAGGNPYPGMEMDETFITRLKNGYRMEKPKFAPDSMYVPRTADCTALVPLTIDKWDIKITWVVTPLAVFGETSFQYFMAIQWALYCC